MDARGRPGAPPADWEAAAAALVGQGGLVLVLGASDTGKTTLTRFLVERIRGAGLAVAWIDGDMGQATLGPPTTVTLACFPRGPGPPAPATQRVMRFVGATSPRGHMLPTVVGLARLAARARTLGADATIVDTTGLVNGPAALALKTAKCELLQPTACLALERAGELEELLQGLPAWVRPRIRRLAAAPFSRPRSWQTRRAYREARLRAYFQEARSLPLPASLIAHARPVGLPKPEEEAAAWTDLVVGLNDEGHDTLALGVVEAGSPGEGWLVVRTPLGSAEAVRAIVPGSLRWRVEHILDGGSR
ncbi:MAG: hypothetical protein HYV08_00540 [Deltaproteobacteria bacterium]|nr:hypothetical protein [Deltaproteobacteria bacterium]